LKLTTLSPFHLQTLFSLLEGRLQVNTEAFTLFLLFKNLKAEEMTFLFCLL